MSTDPHDADGISHDDSEGLQVVTARVRAADVERLDIAADRRGIGRDELIAQAIDAFLARETWSGGFIAPPPPMEIPGRFAWGPETFRLRRRR